jgi:tetratricopeptide (TPR) repeat protein
MCLAQYNLKHIDCVEIAPEVVQIALKFFKHINLGDQVSEKVNMIYMDAKNYLHLTPRRYDIIVNDADLPAQSGSAPLFAKEHFQNALEHLNPRGVFITKLHLADITLSSFDSILGTFLEVYPHVTIWFPVTKPYIFFYLVGSRQKQLFSPTYIDGKMAKENVHNSVAYLNFHNSVDILSCYIGDENDINRYLKKYFHINSDYTPYVEFDFGQGYSLITSGLFQEFIETVRQNSLLNHIDWTGLSESEQDKWRKDYQLLYRISSYVLKSHSEQEPLIVLWNSFEGLRLMPKHAALLEQEDENLLFVQTMLFRNERFDADKAIVDMDTLLQQQPDFGTAWLIKSWALQQKNEMSEALNAAKKAVQHAPNTLAAHDNLGMILVKLGQLDKAVDHYSLAIQLMPPDIRLHNNLGAVFFRQGRVEEAISQFCQALRIQPYSAEIHFALGYALEELGRKDEAVEEYREALRINPKYFRARERLNAALGR